MMPTCSDSALVMNAAALSAEMRRTGTGLHEFGPRNFYTLLDALDGVAAESAGVPVADVPPEQTQTIQEALEARLRRAGYHLMMYNGLGGVLGLLDCERIAKELAPYVAGLVLRERLNAGRAEVA